MYHRDIYFVAFYKHDAPQHLTAGPYVDEGEARAEADKQSSGVVVKTTLLFEVCE